MRHKRRKLWKITWMICMTIWVVVGYYLFVYEKTFSKKEIDEMFEPITSRYGIKIIYEVGDDFFSDIENPPFPVGPDRDSKIKSIAHEDLAKYPLILENALNKYPVEVVRRYLSTVYFVGEINHNGFKAAGSYDPFRHIIYLANNGHQSDDFAQSIVHHEFSSLLILGNSFFLNPWERQNPAGFSYLLETFDNLKSIQEHIKIKLSGTEKDFKNGFLNIYGQTDFENDFNEYSAMIFTYPEKFKKIMNEHPRVRGKFLVWLDFYHKIDPIFTEEYLLGKS